MNDVSDLMVTPDAVETMAATVGQAGDEITAILAELAGANATLAGGWTGEAQLAYERAHASWAARMATDVATLAHAVQAVQQAAKTYREADQRVGRLWTL